MKIKPSKEVIDYWIEHYVPVKDLFFLSQEPSTYNIDFKDVLVIPEREFINHTVYQQLHYLNSYTYWNIKGGLYVIVAEKHWIEHLPKNKKKLILHEQVKCHRGLIFPLTFIEDITTVPPEYILGEQIIIQRAIWEQWNKSCKEQFLLTMVREWWDNGECEPLPPFIDDYLVPFANKFGTVQGANCLACVLFALSKGTQQWFLNEWIHQNTFLEKLQQYQYVEVLDENLLAKDIVVWKDTNGIIQHAAYHIGDGYFFNKHGQTMFNPWKILLKDPLYKEWELLTPITFRLKNL